MHSCSTLDSRARPPSWVRRADRALAQAVRQTRVIAAATPRNHRPELDRIAARMSAGEFLEPCFEYAPPRPELALLRPALDELASGLEQEGELGRVYAAKARELDAEAAICERVGDRGFVEVARRRFGAPEPDLLAASDLALHWLSDAVRFGATPDDAAAALVRSDDTSDPGSLVSSLSAELGRRGLPFRVITSPHMSALAATGDGVLIVASGRWITRQDVARTVLHEIEGHAAPSARAIGSRLGIFALGTAGGSDDQEGRALCLEAEGGYHTWPRRRELALRHVAALTVWGGASFVETARDLLGRGADVPAAARIAARVHRGGGLAREVVYLPAFIRVAEARRQRPRIDWVLASGKVSVNAVPALVAWMADESPSPSPRAADPTT